MTGIPAFTSTGTNIVLVRRYDYGDKFMLRGSGLNVIGDARRQHDRYSGVALLWKLTRLDGNDGIGYRTAVDLLIEISYHLSQPSVYTPIVSVGGAGFGSGGFGGGGFGGGVGSAIQVNSTYAMYPGADIVVGWKTANVEVATVLTVVDSTHFTATLANAHSPGDIIIGATFPTQQTTDPIYTQSEMLQYLSRAQNEFLTAVPCYYQRFFQNVNAGILYQATPPTAVLIDRIAASMLNLPIVSMTRTANTVTLATPIPHGLSQYSTFAVANANSLGDTTFAGGAFAVISAPTPTTLTYRQIGSDAIDDGRRDAVYVETV